ncbi:MAG TPA: GNA1162 family protein [Anaeromyxobacteraceae bacterium]|nr:GNA1162 family protein [Anaeromyxobacteraceae bacterium]
MTRPSRTVRLALAALAAAALAACAAPPKKDLGKFMAAQPRSILVLPVVNNSVDVTAGDYFLSTVPVPLAERGYYVFPVNLVKRLLEDDGLADASLVHGAPTGRVGNLFGADAVLYIVIQKWEAQWVLVSTSVTVQLEYTLRDAKTGDVIWQDKRTKTYSSDSGGGGLIGAIVNAAVTKASPNYMPLALQANWEALTYPGPGFPAGPYRAEYKHDYQPGAP